MIPIGLDIFDDDGDCFADIVQIVVRTYPLNATNPGATVSEALDIAEAFAATYPRFSVSPSERPAFTKKPEESK